MERDLITSIIATAQEYNNSNMLLHSHAKHKAHIPILVSKAYVTMFLHGQCVLRHLYVI